MDTAATTFGSITPLTDFGPGREEIFGNSADAYLQVHHLGAADADVTEGSGGAWERLHYDWTDPHRVVMTTTDIDAVVVRDGKNLEGRALGVVLGAFGTRVLGKVRDKTVLAIEARNHTARTADNT
ncbi:MAG: hypothetical protein AAGC80_12345 [Rhodococcus sp. (in: high G+C Gram-positive bacteria)]